MTGTHAYVPVPLLLALLGVAPGCGTKPIKIATMIDEASVEAAVDASGDAGLIACTASDGGDDCPDGSFCGRTLCGPMGFCETRPPETSCPASASASMVCGCDGIAYFNDCLRRADGVSQGSCLLPPTPCGPGLPPCDKGVCALVLPTLVLSVYEQNDLCHDQILECWRFPTTCPADGGSLAKNLCEPAGRCVDECTALRDGGVYQACTSP
jgi:hypothetical protein